METSSMTDRINSTELLKQALTDSEVILAYATENGLDINKDHIKTIVESKKLEESKQWTQSHEIDFWMAYKNVSKLIYPVTIDSLRAAQEYTSKSKTWYKRINLLWTGLSLSHRSVRMYRFLTLISMLLMLMIQIYSLKGTTLLSTIQSCDSRIKQIELRLGELMQITSADKNNQTAMLEKERLENEMSELDKKKSSSITLLEPWVRFIGNFTGNNLRDRKKGMALPSQQNVPISANESMDDKISIIQEAQNYVLILSLYVLPLLYGLLGGFAYVLRSLAVETKHRIFSKESNIKYTLRIHLGALAGLAIGLLWGDIEKQAFGFVQTLSPLALAFIAGYSVEFLFNGIDRIVTSVAKKKNYEETTENK